LIYNQFGLVVGVAYTGILFAAAVAGGRHVGILRADGVLHGPPPDAREVLLVDDVVFSGTSISRAKTQLENQGYRVTAFACIVDRTSEMQTGANADQTNITLPLYSSYTV
jgi:orotate phosphoribosyltransferase